MLPLIALVVTSTPAIDVYTFGPGDDIFSHFGHSAICVAADHDDRCYNFGTANFDTPLPLTRDFIRGRAIFWVSVVPRAPMLRFYRDEDRSIIRQRLPLSAGAARRLASDLADSARGEARYYRYHHYFDNCTTRIRDLVDRSTDGQLRAWATDAEPGPTLREHTRRGFAAQPALLTLSALILGRRVDAPPTAWASMFLPAELERGLAAALSAQAVTEYRRRGPLPPERAAPWQWWLAGLGAALAVALALDRRRRAVWITALVLGLIACVPWTLAVASAFPELRHNEVLLVLWPSDTLLGVLRGRLLRGYLGLRLVTLVLLAIAMVAGVCVQPLGPMWALVALPLLVMWRRR